MALFSRRSPGYKAGMVVIIVCTLLHLIGYVSPYWTMAEDATSKANQGLWMLCVSSPRINTCIGLGFRAVKVWFHIVRLMESVGLALLFGSSAYGISANCCTTLPKNVKTLEAFALVGGLLAFIGAMIFVGQVESVDQYKELRQIGWAFYLTAVGSGLAVIASIVVFITNKPLDGPATTTGTIGMANVGGYPSAVVVQSGRVQSAYPPPSSAAAQPYGFPAPAYSAPPPQAGYPSKR